METINEIIASRRSTVLFSGKKIKEEIINSLFEAARWAPSSMNIQPWRFVYVLKDDPDFEAWINCLNEGNREWAKNAPLLVLTVAQRISDYNMIENPYAMHDTAMAYSNLVFQALSLGLSVHPMGGYDKMKISDQVHLPAGYDPLIVAAVGYKSTSLDFPDRLLEKENSVRDRKPVSEISFRGQFQLSDKK